MWCQQRRYRQARLVCRLPARRIPLSHLQPDCSGHLDQLHTLSGRWAGSTWCFRCISLCQIYTEAAIRPLWGHALWTNRLNHWRPQAPMMHWSGRAKSLDVPWCHSQRFELDRYWHWQWAIDWFWHVHMSAPGMYPEPRPCLMGRPLWSHYVAGTQRTLMQSVQSGLSSSLSWFWLEAPECWCGSLLH